MIDYYQILGVPRNAPQTLIKKTYTALQKIYHPDIYMGDKSFATKKVQEINEAYKILSDKKKREAHDNELNSQQNNHDGFEDKDPWDEKAEETYSSMKESEWDYISSFYPDVDARFKELKKLSGAVAFQFRMILVDTKAFKDFRRISDRLEQEFLSSKFGGSYKIQRLARDAIYNNNRKFAKDLNKALNVLGQDSFEEVLRKLAKDHNKFAVEFYPRYALQHLVVMPKQKSRTSSAKQKGPAKQNINKSSRKPNKSQPLMVGAAVLVIFFILMVVTNPPENNGGEKQVASQEQTLKGEDLANKLYDDITANIDWDLVRLIPDYKNLIVSADLGINTDGYLYREIIFEQPQNVTENYKLFEDEVKKAIRATLPFTGFSVEDWPTGIDWGFTVDGQYDD